MDGPTQREKGEKFLALHHGAHILAGPGAPTIPELETLGVARVSFGGGPMRATMALIRRIGKELLETGAYTALDQPDYTHVEANRLFQK